MTQTDNMVQAGSNLSELAQVAMDHKRLSRQLEKRDFGMPRNRLIDLPREMEIRENFGKIAVEFERLVQAEEINVTAMLQDIKNFHKDLMKYTGLDQGTRR